MQVGPTSLAEGLTLLRCGIWVAHLDGVQISKAPQKQESCLLLLWGQVAHHLAHSPYLHVRKYLLSLSCV